MAKIGLLAGYGKLPMIFSDAARKKGDTVIAFGLKGVTQESLAGHVDKLHWLEWGNFQKGLLLLAAERLKKIIMLGKIKKTLFFKNEDKLDSEAKSLLDRIKDKKDYAILNEAAKVFGKLGIEVIDSTTYLKDFIPSKGTLSKREPTKEEWEDIRYGVDVASKFSQFDIGQTVIIKDKTVIAIEAVEGTDEAIRRAGALTGGGFAVVKAARPDQDMRFDVPLVGLDTLEALVESKGSVLALEAGKTLLIDREEIVKLADSNDISIVVI